MYIVRNWLPPRARAATAGDPQDVLIEPCKCVVLQEH